MQRWLSQLEKTILICISFKLLIRFFKRTIISECFNENLFYVDNILVKLTTNNIKSSFLFVLCFELNKTIGQSSLFLFTDYSKQKSLSNWEVQCTHLFKHKWHTEGRCGHSWTMSRYWLHKFCRHPIFNHPLINQIHPNNWPTCNSKGQSYQHVRRFNLSVPFVTLPLQVKWY